MTVPALRTCRECRNLVVKQTIFPQKLEEEYSCSAQGGREYCKEEVDRKCYCVYFEDSNMSIAPSLPSKPTVRKIRL